MQLKTLDSPDILEWLAEPSQSWMLEPEADSIETEELIETCYILYRMLLLSVEKYKQNLGSQLCKSLLDLDHDRYREAAEKLMEFNQNLFDQQDEHQT